MGVKSGRCDVQAPENNPASRESDHGFNFSQTLVLKNTPSCQQFWWRVNHARERRAIWWRVNNACERREANFGCAERVFRVRR